MIIALSRVYFRIDLDRLMVVRKRLVVVAHGASLRTLAPMGQTTPKGPRHIYGPRVLDLRDARNARLAAAHGHGRSSNRRGLSRRT